MSVQNHIDELEKRRRALKTEIARERTAPGTDDRKVLELKKRNLVLKDEITRLSHAA